MLKLCSSDGLQTYQTIIGNICKWKWQKFIKRDKSNPKITLVVQFLRWFPDNRLFLMNITLSYHDKTLKATSCLKFQRFMIEGWCQSFIPVVVVFCWDGGEINWYLSSIGRGDDSGYAPTLLHIPQEPESRDLMGLCSNTKVHKERGKILCRSAQEKSKNKIGKCRRVAS